VVRVLLELKGFDIILLTDSNSIKSLFCCAIYKNHEAEMRLLYDKHKTDLNKRYCVLVKFLLIWAASHEHGEVVKELLGQGSVIPNVSNKIYCRTPP
jgi:hypothetical protein